MLSKSGAADIALAFSLCPKTHLRRLGQVPGATLFKYAAWVPFIPDGYCHKRGLILWDWVLVSIFCYTALRMRLPVTAFACREPN